MIAEPLPEMGADIWQAGHPGRRVGAPTRAPPVSPAAEAWADEARLLPDRERARRRPARGGAAAGRGGAGRRAGRRRRAGGAVVRQALAQDPNAADVVRARARLAEGRGELDDAHALWARMATGSESADERAFYGELSAEWTLAGGGKLPPIARRRFPRGRRARSRRPRRRCGRAWRPTSPRLSPKPGREMGGALGAALLEQAGRCREEARDRAARPPGGRAAKLDPFRRRRGGRLRDAARADDRGAARSSPSWRRAGRRLLRWRCARWTRGAGEPQR